MRRIAAFCFLFFLSACLAGCLGGRAVAHAGRKNFGRATEQPGLQDDLNRLLDEALAKTPDQADNRHESPPPVFAAELLPASANRGEALLSPQALHGCVVMMDALKRLGATGITVKAGYPLLTRDFPRYREYLDFYKTVAAEVRKRGMTLLIKTGPVFEDTEFSTVKAGMKSMTLEKYLAGRREAIETIARELRPDWITIGSEPKTEKTLTGQNLTPEVYARFVDETVVSARQPGVRFSVGIGTWDDFDYAKAFANTRVDALDIHLYPVYGRNLDKLRDISRLAREHGKTVTMSEAWLYKSLGREGGAPEATWGPIFARDVFADWADADAKFVTLTARLARLNGVRYVSFFWSKYFFAYLPRDDRTEGLPSQRLQRMSNRPAWEAMQAGRVTASDRAFEREATAR